MWIWKGMMSYGICPSMQPITSPSTINSKLKMAEIAGAEQSWRKPSDTGEGGLPRRAHGLHHGPWWSPWLDLGGCCRLAPLFSVPLHLMLLLGPWYLTRFGRIWCLWASFIIVFDPPCLKYIFKLYVWGLQSRNLQKCSKQVKTHIIEKIGV